MSFITPLSSTDRYLLSKADPLAAGKTYSTEFRSRLRGWNSDPKVEYLAKVNSLFTGKPDDSYKVYLSTLPPEEIEEMYIETVRQVGDKIPVPTPDQTLKSRIGSGISDLRTNISNDLLINGSRYARTAGMVGAGLAGAGVLGTIGYNLLPVDTQQAIADIIPGDDSASALAYREQRRIQDENNAQWDRMRPYMPTPAEQMAMARDQQAYIARQQTNYGELNALKQARIAVLNNTLANMTRAGSNSGQIVNGMM